MIDNSTDDESFKIKKYRAERVSKEQSALYLSEKLTSRSFKTAAGLHRALLVNGGATWFPEFFDDVHVLPFKSDNAIILEMGCIQRNREF